MSTVLVTGCSSGFGLLIARQLAAGGDRVFAGVRNRSSAAKLEAAQTSGLPITIVDLDVTDPVAARAAVADVVAQTGRIDALVNNAGVSMFAAVEEVSVDDARAMMETNYFGPLRLIQLVLPYMRAQHGGRIVNVSSYAGCVPVAYMSTYVASKHALDSMSFCLAAEVHQFGIRLSLVAPGGYATSVGSNLWPPSRPMPELGYRAAADAMVAGWHEAVKGTDPREVAEAVKACLTDAEPPMRVFVPSQVGMAADAFRSLDAEAARQSMVS